MDVRAMLYFLYKFTTRLGDKLYPKKRHIPQVYLVKPTMATSTITVYRRDVILPQKTMKLHLLRRRVLMKEEANQFFVFDMTQYRILCRELIET